MRTFISIDIPEEVRQEIKKIQDSLPGFQGKKTEFENLHLTLKFLGEIDDEKLEKVKEKLNEFKFNNFETEINCIGVFSKEFVRIVWLHLKDCGKLQKEIDKELSLLFESEKRFMSHLTIARVKKCDKKKFLEDLHNIKIPMIKFNVDNFKLKKSTLTKQGPVYETLEEFRLR